MKSLVEKLKSAFSKTAVNEASMGDHPNFWMYPRPL